MRQEPETTGPALVAIVMFVLIAIGTTLLLIYTEMGFRYALVCSAAVFGGLTSSVSSVLKWQTLWESPAIEERCGPEGARVVYFLLGLALAGLGVWFLLAFGNLF